MPCIRVGRALVSVGTVHEIEVDGAVHSFEISDYFGPVVLGKRGEPLRRQPGAVLRAIEAWMQQGQRVKGNRCVWTRAAGGGR